MRAAVAAINTNDDMQHFPTSDGIGSRTATPALRSFNSDRYTILPEVILDRFGTGRILSSNPQSVAFFLGLHQTSKMDDAILDDDVLR